MESIETYLNLYHEAIIDTDRDRALRIIATAREAGVKPEEILSGILIPSINRFMNELLVNPASLAQHFIGSQIANEIVDQMIPLFTSSPEMTGRIVIGTPVGDFHGLGKKIVSGYLRANFIDVVDLGLNISPERFVIAAIESGAEVIGISSMMVHTARGENGPLGVRRVLRERGLEGKIRLVVGGVPYRFDRELYLKVGADAWGEDASAAVAVVTEQIREARKR